MPTPRPDTLFPLNHTEHAYVAFDGVMGSMVQPYLLRFDQPLQAERVRGILREMISAYPRMRGVPEAGVHRYRLRILPDDHIVDQLFEHAWRLDAHLDATDARAMEGLHQRLLNEVLPLERGLGCRFVFIPHERTPVLFFAMHHILGDGRTMIQLLTELMRRLNGGPAMVPQPVEAPSMMGALKPASLWAWPRHMWRSRRHVVAEAEALKRLNVQQLVTSDQPFLSLHALKHYTVPCPAEALRPVARELGISVNSLVTLALAETYLAQAPEDPRAAAVIRQSLDVRRFYPPEAAHGPLWGNHVGAFLVIETGRKTLRERALSIKRQIDEAMGRYQRREMFWTYAFYGLMPYMGRTLLAFISVNMQRQLKVPNISCHATSLGNVSALNPPEATVRLKDFVPAVPSLSMMHVVSELDGQLTMPLIWQRCQASPEHMDAYLRRLDEVFLGLARGHGQPAPEQATDTATDTAADKATAPA